MDGASEIVLTKPFFSSTGDSSSDYRPPNLIRRILSLFRHVRIGSDFSTMQLPAQFNIPKSHLQMYGEIVYSLNNEMLGKCNRGTSATERFVSVIAWSMSITQPMIFGTAPYNSILGETHHVSRANLNVLLEQISHHPPVSALHATDEKDNIELVWCHNTVAKFYGTYIQVEALGKRHLNLLNHRETYAIKCPELLVRLLPFPGMEWTGKHRITCSETGLEAELTHGGSSFFSLRGNPKLVKGKLFHSSSSKPLFSIDGAWNETISITDLSNGETRVIYDAKESLSELKAPFVKDPKGIRESESVFVWNEVSHAILKKEWAKAIKAKRGIEEKQRKVARERKSREESWVSKHFRVSYSKEDGWDCAPIEKIVPPAPIIVPNDS